MSDDASPRRDAIASLDPDARSRLADKLVRILSKDGPEHNRAVRALVEMGAPAVDPLMRVLMTPLQHCIGDYRAKFGAMRALGEIGEPRALHAIRAGLSHSALWDMHHLHGECTHELPTFYNLMASDAIVALGEGAARIIVDEAIKSKWRSGNLQYEYGYGLSRIVASGARDTVIDGLTIPVVSRDMALILARTRDQEAVPALAALLDGDYRRYDVAFALARINGEAAQQALETFEARNRREIDQLLCDSAGMFKGVRRLDNSDVDRYLYLLARHNLPEAAALLLAAGDRDYRGLVFLLDDEDGTQWSNRKDVRRQQAMLEAKLSARID